MKLLVTGGAGFIGSNFIRHVLAARKDYALVNYDKLTYAGNLANLAEVAEDPNYTFIRGDICDAARVEAAMRGCDAVVHFAAESHGHAWMRCGGALRCGIACGPQYL